MFIIKKSETVTSIIFITACGLLSPFGEIYHRSEKNITVHEEFITAYRNL